MEALDTLNIDAPQSTQTQEPEPAPSAIQLIDRRKQLTPRETQVLHLISDGRTTEEMACLLSMSIKTAEAHRTRLYRKLEAKNAPHAVRIALRQGLIEA